MVSILFTFVVLKLDTSKEINEEHKANIAYISLTFEVSKLDKFNEINEEQT